MTTSHPNPAGPSEASDRLTAALKRIAPRPEWSIAEHRARWEKTAATQPTAAGVSLKTIETPAGPAEWAIPPGNPTDTALYLHGGGFIMGSLMTSRAFASCLALMLDRRVLTFDYPLAPEVVFPQQVRSVQRCLKWMHANAPAGSTIALIGDSAGGSLAVGALLDMAKHGDKMPEAVVLMSPFLNLTLSSASIVERSETDSQTPRWLLELMRDAYTAPSVRDDLRLTPARAQLAGFPRFLIQVSDSEALLGDAVEFAEALSRQGIECALEIWRGLPHVWQTFAPRLPEAVEALAHARDWLDEGTAPKTGRRKPGKG